jgi:Methyltransferase domain
VFKEFWEAVPIIDAVIRLVDESNNENFTIVDLASGKGYLSMLLSELLPQDKVTKFILVDKAWPMCNSEPSPHHMSWEHIYGNKTETESYFDTWPIPLHTSKQDLKKSYNVRQLKKRLFDPAPGPIIILAVHLCGTLSLRAVDMFNNHDNVRFFALKPCCLPTMTHVERNEIFHLGNYSFDSKLVCAPGKWSKKQWYGPPRWHLEPKFDAWVEHLFLGVCGAGLKIQSKVVVQHDGGFQNAFIFAERKPISSSMWRKINGR